MTPTRSDIDSASLWSCVTNRVVTPRLRCSRFSSICISSRSCASRLESGSSNSRTRGSGAIARAMRDALLLSARELARVALAEAGQAAPCASASSTRCLSSAPRNPAGAGRRRRSRTRSDAETAHRTEKRARARAGSAAGRSRRRPPMRIRPWLGSTSPADHAQHRRLAAAGRAQERDELALADLDRNVAHHRGAIVRLAQPLERQSAHRAAPAPSARRICSARHLALPPARPLRRILGDDLGIDEPGLLQALAVGHERLDLVRQLHLGVDRADIGVLREARLAFGRQDLIEEFQRELRLRRSLRDDDGGQDADRAFLGIGDRE